MDEELGWPGALQIAAAVRAGRLRATDIAAQTLHRIELKGPAINAVTQSLPARAMTEAAAVDAKIARGEDPGPLAGTPYGVKDLFDVKDLATTAGAASRRAALPAARDAEAIERLRQAGAVLVATLNMDAFAYGFVTDNAYWGVTRNPYDLRRFAGGSSGGSAAAVADGLLSFSLGSDTNGSIRVPASLCGVYGLKPTHGGLPMAGVFPFAESLDDIGPFARSAADLAEIYAALRAEPVSHEAMGRRCARLGGWFDLNLTSEMQEALDRLCAHLGGPPAVQLEEIEQARSAAFIITAAEAGALHRDCLRADAMAYDPAIRDRLLAGAAVPHAAYKDALTFRKNYRRRVLALFEHCDVLLAPTVVGPAPLIDNPIVMIDGRPAPARANLGAFTQPISFVGLPVVTAPLRRPRGLPLGVQLIGAPGKEIALLAFAAHLESEGLIGFTPPQREPSAARIERPHAETTSATGANR